ncbi:MAG: hypothetical protein HYY00_09385 [Chloroflexi bacterium]|nr:hypothetical protein [Chloroflexota bacterium]
MNKHGSPWRLSVLPVAALALIVMMAATACAEQARSGSPALPPGFTDTPLPQVDVNGYVYVAQGSPLLVSAQSFGSQAPQESDRDLSVKASRLMAWLGPSADLFGGRAQFATSDDSELVLKRLTQEGAQDQRVWAQQQGDSVLLVKGAGDWATSLKEALLNNTNSTLKEKYPEVWELMELLPENPPNPPVAAGFLRELPTLVESLAGNRGLEIQGLQSALSFVKVESAAFAAYSQPMETLPAAELTAEELKQTGVGAVIVTKAGYPGFVVNMMLGSFASRAGLEEVSLGEEKVRYRVLDNRLHLMVRNFGSTLFIVAAPDRETAEALTKAVLAQQAKGK